MTNDKTKFIIGGGISGLIYAFYNKDFQIISPDIGGKLKNSYLTSTILLHDTLETKKLLEDLQLGRRDVRKKGREEGTDPKALERLIEQKLGLLNYFGRMTELASFLEKNSIGRVRIRGLNSAFEIEAYAAAGGFEQPMDGLGMVRPRECEMLASEIRRLGYPIRSLGVTIEASQRRKLFELISGVDSYFTVADSDGRFVFVRRDEESLLREALQRVPRDGWIAYQRKQLRTLVKNIILDPLVRGEITTDSLMPITGEEERKELQKDLSQFSGAELCTKWADILIELSEKAMLLRST